MYSGIDYSNKQSIESVLEKGFTAVKFCPFNRLKLVDSYEKVKEAGNRVKKARQITGNEVDIMLDFHGRTSPAMAVIACKDGYIEVLKKPGLGIELDEEAIVKRPYQSRDVPHLYHEDGSFAVW